MSVIPFRRPAPAKPVRVSDRERMAELTNEYTACQGTWLALPFIQLTPSMRDEIDKALKERAARLYAEIEGGAA